MRSVDLRGFALSRNAVLSVYYFVSECWIRLSDQAASLITDIASVYVIAASGVVAAFMGFNAYSAKALAKKHPYRWRKR